MSSEEELEDIGELEERYPHDVYLYMYDITDGLACRYSPLLFGQRLRALYDTGVVVRWLDGDLESWFGGRIQTKSAGHTPYGEPLERRFMGTTFRTREEIGAFLEFSSSTFVPNSYDIAFHNCNSFSAAMLEFLCEMQLPPDVLEQAGLVLNTDTGYLGYQVWKTLNRWDAARPRLPGA
ncbi:desi1 [Symbiodinium sp. CCMP2592]|nr:desi1 [Symbiodinium sp. CCMP2592]